MWFDLALVVSIAAVVIEAYLLLNLRGQLATLKENHARVVDERDAGNAFRDVLQRELKRLTVADRLRYDETNGIKTPKVLGCWVVSHSARREFHDDDLFAYSVRAVNSRVSVQKRHRGEAMFSVEVLNVPANACVFGHLEEPPSAGA